jgi:predicted nuclease of restriction endonuclease-like RecB superfamily
MYVIVTDINGKIAGEYTRCFFKKTNSRGIKVKEQIEIALNSKLLEESNAKFRNYIDNALMAFCC